MLTAHQRLAIRARLPEVRDVLVCERTDDLVPPIVRLLLHDGTEVAIYGAHMDKAARSRLRPDYSDRVDDVPIPLEMRRRLEAAFGPLRYRGD